MSNEEKIAVALRTDAQAKPNEPVRYVSASGRLKVTVMWDGEGCRFHLWVLARGDWPHRSELQMWADAFHVPQEGRLAGPVNLGQWKGRAYEWNPRSEAKGQLKMAA